MNALNTLELPILHAIQDAIGCSFLDTFFSLITKLGGAHLPVRCHQGRNHYLRCYDAEEGQQLI